MNELELKYGCNPNQKPARVFMKDGGDLPFTVLNGKPGYINLLDAFNSFQLVRELKEATGLPAAASFKHVAPAGAALGLPLDEVDKQIYFVEPDEALSPIACAYIRARGADRLFRRAHGMEHPRRQRVGLAEPAEILRKARLVAPQMQMRVKKLLFPAQKVGQGHTAPDIR